MPSLTSSELRHKVMEAMYYHERGFQDILAGIVRATQVHNKVCDAPLLRLWNVFNGRLVCDVLAFDAALGFLPYIMQFITVQLPEVININIDVEQRWQDMLVGARHVLLFVIAHERSTAIVLFILAIVLGFPIEILLSIVLFIPQALLLAALVCIDLGTGRVREGRLAASYQSRMFQRFTPAGSYASAGRSRVSIGFIQVPTKHPLLVPIGWMCMAAFLTLLINYLHQGRILKEILDAISTSSPLC
ncbi:hypothetical protein APHAL10511_000036 [Amanita phalloides]|nr:hypothetical protein APHAL10511_000036 [Amanita phalloides]